MRFTSLLIGTALAACLGQAANAADLIMDSPVAAAEEVTDWSGFYAGLHGGYGAGTMYLDGAAIDPDDEEHAFDGFFGGVQAGYNAQFDSLLLGVQTDISLSGIRYEEDAGGEDDTLDWFGSTTARIGFVAGDFVPYLKGGIAYGGVTGHAAGEEISQVHLGWTAGAGVEVAVAENMSVFAEYAYYDFETKTYAFDLAGDIEGSMDVHTVKAGLNFSF